MIGRLWLAWRVPGAKNCPAGSRSLVEKADRVSCSLCGDCGVCAVVYVLCSVGIESVESVESVEFLRSTDTCTMRLRQMSCVGLAQGALVMHGSSDSLAVWYWQVWR